MEVHFLCSLYNKTSVQIAHCCGLVETILSQTLFLHLKGEHFEAMDSNVNTTNPHSISSTTETVISVVLVFACITVAYLFSICIYHWVTHCCHSYTYEEDAEENELRWNPVRELPQQCGNHVGNVGGNDTNDEEAAPPVLAREYLF